MTRSVVLTVCGLTVAAWAHSNPLCDAAQEALQRFAQTRGLMAEARCRALPSPSMPIKASLLAMVWPKGQIPRSGTLTWPVRVQASDGWAYVQQVPLTVVWTAPAWVGARNLAPGTVLDAADLELQPRRWPDGVAVEPADVDFPPSGRLRSALRAGDIVTAAALLPTGALMRGDNVVVVLTQGAVEVRLPAQLLAPSRVGETARAQVSGRSVPIEGRLVDAQTLWVVSE